MRTINGCWGEGQPITAQPAQLPPVTSLATAPPAEAPECVACRMQEPLGQVRARQAILDGRGDMLASPCPQQPERWHLHPRTRPLAGLGRRRSRQRVRRVMPPASSPGGWSTPRAIS